MNPLIEKTAFIGLMDHTWFYSGAESPPHQGCMDAVNEYMMARTLGPDGRERNTQVEQTCKSNIAQLLKGKPADIAFLSNSSEAISMIAQSLVLEKGDNIVINTLEFPSGILPWLLLKDKGVEVRIVNHANWEISVEDIMNQVDSHTKLVMTSHVSYLSGARLDYKALYAQLKTTEALLLLDITQSLGAVAVDMNHADFVVCSSYKWLLSIHGLSILGINPARAARFNSRSIGWRSVTDMFGPNRFEAFDFHADARRFELGFPSYPTIYATNFSTSLLLEIGESRIESHILELGRYLIDQLTELGYEIMTPSDPERRAGNICIVAKHGDKIAENLRKQRVYIWGGDGRFRVSLHVFNDKEDIDKLVLLLGMKQL
ncbi:cysteine desulfurase [Paenibacillus baekrokdamisoli]|uniref:Cysteine desulfurase n=1 Tax=Paenibacillus baekrokdamisoli TaxID=1712516 RepID=A0A3G9IUL4_9BACL|nr:aminotransferase class V-fold PLP-dependent enzyme [Paenibacillus baekrokdamisoli]MBB3067073.1 selenocysteine lyase/cysteine desulfurase [Paenibacillus baekrokdamisoli]BBH19735.1 cysteine desulfurase [Paenibacillus baekrokdamisoli]